MIVRRLAGLTLAGPALAGLTLAGLIAGCTGVRQAGPEPAPASSTATTTPDRTAKGHPAKDRAALLDRLRTGGYVLYLRHAATEATQDDPAPDLSDATTQRNLSAEGRDQARRIGDAVRRLRIPIGRVRASPYQRTLDTGRLAFGRAEPARDLLNEAYPGTDDERLAGGLRRLLRERPAAGTDTVLVSHGFNLNEVTGLSVAEGDTVVFRPGTAEPLDVIGVDEWTDLAGRPR